MRSVKVPALSILYNEEDHDLFVAVVHDVPMDTSVRPSGTDFKLYVDGNLTALAALPGVWSLGKVLSFETIVYPTIPTEIRLVCPSYLLNYRWKPGKLVDPYDTLTTSILVI